MDATRARIVAAAAELFRVQGVIGTTIRQVAVAADVSPGTVRNHFGTIDALAEAVAEHVMATLEMPTAAIFDGLVDIGARVTALARAMAAYYVRSQPWYRMDQLDDRPVRAWTDARARYDAAFVDLVHEALGPLAHDDDAVSMVMTLVGPTALVGLTASGRSAEEAARLVGEVLATWLAGRGRATRRRRAPVRR
jgi:AcrR family transcriptional regulator